MKSAWKQLDEHPPCLVRLLARRAVKGKNVRAMSSAEVAIAAGIPLARIQQISRMTDWSAVTVTEAERFVLACNFDPLSAKDRNRKNAYNRSCKNRKKFVYLRESPLFLTEFAPLIELLRSRKAS